MEWIKRPIFNMLAVLIDVLGNNMGLAIIALTLLVRLLLVKQATAGMKMQGELTDMQPKMQEIQEKYKDDPQRMSSEMMQLLKKSGGGPLKGCLTMLIQIPVFLGLFFTIKELANEHFTTELYSFLYSFSIQLDAINTDFLGMQLLDNHNVLFTMLAGLAMWAQLKLTALVNPPKKAWLPGMDKPGMPDMSKMMGTMNIVFVIMMAWFVWNMQSAIGLYIITTTLFGVIQQAIQYRPLLQAKLQTLWTK